MTPEISQQLADLFGQIPLSQLPLGDGSPVTGEYVVYNQNDKLVYRIASFDLYTYFCKNVFRFVFDGMDASATDEKSCILVNPQKYVQQGDTPITYARRLLQQVNKPNEMWIGEPAPASDASRKINISQEWFKHFQYYYFDNLNNRQRTMLLNYGEITAKPNEVASTLVDIFKTEEASLWSNCMWKSHLEPPNTVQQLPCFINNEGHLKMLHVPLTSVVRNPNGTVNDPENFIWSEFQKRNYTKIVTGGWDSNNSDDTAWAAVRTVTVEPSPEVNDDIVDGRGEVVARNIGDIDQTLKAIGEFLDDVFLSIDSMEHTGQVVFTASTEENPLGIRWHNVISSDDQDESFVWSGDNSLTGENDNLVPGIPRHHHNTVLNGSDPMPIQNVSIIGRPEGETVGGIVKVPTAERLPNASHGKKEDSIHKISNTGVALDGIGAYNGTVEYDAYEISATQQRHNNMPLYYKVRAFVHD